MCNFLWTVYPRIEKFDITGSKDIGKDFIVSCTAVGSPDITISLLHNGSIVTQSNNTHGYKKTICFNPWNISSVNSGIYSCVASNDIGSTYANETVVIKGNK